MMRPKTSVRFASEAGPPSPLKAAWDAKTPKPMLKTGGDPGASKTPGDGGGPKTPKSGDSGAPKTPKSGEVEELAKEHGFEETAVGSLMKRGSKGSGVGQ